MEQTETMGGFERLGCLERDPHGRERSERAALSEHLLEVAPVRGLANRVIEAVLLLPAGLQDGEHVRVAQTGPLFRFALETDGRLFAEGLRVNDLGDDVRAVRTAGAEGRAPGGVVEHELEIVSIGQLVADERSSARLSLGTLHGSSTGAYR
jgi:hypothetical protein